MTDVIETPLQPIDPDDSTGGAEPGTSEPARWSTRARQRLMAALVIGAVMVLIGAHAVS